MRTKIIYKTVSPQKKPKWFSHGGVFLCPQPLFLCFFSFLLLDLFKDVGTQGKILDLKTGAAGSRCVMIQKSSQLSSTIIFSIENFKK
jgi:hypothetical protein